jgi:hypothetical protein
MKRLLNNEGARCSVSYGIRCLVSSVWCPVSGARCQVSVSCLSVKHVLSQRTCVRERLYILIDSYPERTWHEASHHGRAAARRGGHPFE